MPLPAHHATVQSTKLCWKLRTYLCNLVLDTALSQETLPIAQCFRPSSFMKITIFLNRRLSKRCLHCNYILFTLSVSNCFPCEAPDCLENCVPVHINNYCSRPLDISINIVDGYPSTSGRSSSFTKKKMNNFSIRRLRKSCNHILFPVSISHSFACEAQNFALKCVYQNTRKNTSSCS